MIDHRKMIEKFLELLSLPKTDEPAQIQDPVFSYLYRK